MERCAFGSVRLFPGYLRIALLWVVQLGAFAQHGRWMELLHGSCYGLFKPQKQV